MNIALPALVILLAIIPGIVLRNSYFGNRFPKQAFEPTATSELASYLVLAIPIDLLALKAVHHYHVENVSIEQLLRSCVGQWTDASISYFAATLREHGPTLALFYLGTIVSAYFLGKFFQRLVWACRWDVHVAPLRMRHDWYYKLYGRLPDMPRPAIPVADVLATHPSEGTRLYSGVVYSFEVTKDGSLKEIVLTGPRRGKGRGKDFKWTRIESRQFIPAWAHLTVNQHAVRNDRTTI